MSKLLEKRNQVLDTAEGIVKGAIDRGEAMTEEEVQKHADLLKQADALNATIEAEKAMASRRVELNAGTRPALMTGAQPNAKRKEATEEYRDAFFAALSGRMDEVKAALTVGSNGTLLPTSVYEKIMNSGRFSGGVLGANVKRIPAFAGTININVGSDSKKGSILGTSTTSDPSSMTNKAVSMYTYTSDVILVDKKLLAGSPAAVEEFLADLLADRLNRGANEHLTTGTGSGQPEGVITGAGLGVTGASTTAVTGDELIDLEHSVPAHLRSGAQWMFNDDTLKYLKKLKNAVTGEYLWQRGNVVQGTPSTFLGYTYVVNDEMPDLGAGAKSILFGNFEWYFVSVAENMFIDTVVDQYKANGQIGLFMHADYAGALADSGVAIKYFKNAAV